MTRIAFVLTGLAVAGFAKWYISHLFETEMVEKLEEYRKERGLDFSN